MLYESVIKNQRQYFFRIRLGMIFLIFIILICGCGAGDNENSDNTAKKLTSKASTIEKLNKLHFIIDKKTKISGQSDLMINIYSEKISAVEQLIIKMPDELIKIYKKDIKPENGIISISEKYRVEFKMADNKYFRINLSESGDTENKIFTAETEIRIKDKSIMTLSAGKRGYINDTIVEVILITKEFRKYFNEGKYTVHSPENLLAWQIPRKYYPARIKVNGITDLNLKISDGLYESFNDYIPEYFSASKYFILPDEVFGTIEPTVMEETDNFKLTAVMFTPLGYNRAQFDEHKFCKKCNVILFYDAKDSDKKFYCPVCGSKMLNFEGPYVHEIIP